MGRERCTSLLSRLVSHLNPPPQAAVPLLLTRYLFTVLQDRPGRRQRGLQQTFLKCPLWFAKDSLALDVWTKVTVRSQVSKLGRCQPSPTAFKTPHIPALPAGI